METCTMPRVLSVMPTALTEGSPPLEARTVYAMALAISRFLLARFTLYAMSGRRAPTLVAPAVRGSFAYPKAGFADGFGRSDEGQDAAVVIGVALAVQHDDAGDSLNGVDQRVNGLGLPAFAEVGDALDKTIHDRSHPSECVEALSRWLYS